MALADVVVVSYNSRAHLRGCVEELSHEPDLHVVVADNASPDRSLEAVAGLPVTALALERNGGFAYGCNAGIRAGSAPFVLLLNPDARISAAAVRRLVETLEGSPRAGAVAPRIVDEAGELQLSLRRFPRLRSTYAQALFLHRLFPSAPWADELLTDEDVYRRPGPVDWVSGACVLLRRSALEEIDGLDEGFFMYCEDIDLSRRLRDAGWDVLFEPSAEVVHAGGASAPHAALLPALARSRIRYARKHRSSPVAAAERLGVALGALTHAAVGRRGARRGHLRALGASTRPS